MEHGVWMRMKWLRELMFRSTLLVCVHLAAVPALAGTTFVAQFRGAWFGDNADADASAACGSDCQGFNSSGFLNEWEKCRDLDPWGRYGGTSNVTGFYRVDYPADASPLVNTQATTYCYIYNSNSVGCPTGYDGPGYCEKTDAVNMDKTRGAEQCDGGSPGTFAGNPIDFGARRKIEKEVDYRGAGSFPLEFVRIYNSDLALTGEQAWSHGYSARLILGGGSAAAPEIITYASDSGARILFNDDPSGGWTTWDDLHMSLSYSAATSEWTLTDSAAVTRVFDSTGALISISDRSGRTHSVSHVATAADHVDCKDDSGLAGGLLTTVTHFTGRSLALCRIADRLKYLDDPAGNRTQYAYVTAPHENSDVSPNFLVLDAVTYPNGDRREYV